MNLHTSRNNTKVFALIALSVLAILLYSSLSDMFPMILLPLLSVCFVLFCRFIDKKQLVLLMLLVVYLLFFEAGKNYPFLSTLTFFSLVYYFLMPYIQYLVRSPKILIPFYTFGIYYGYGAFCILIGSIVGLETPHIPLLFLLFATIESLILVFLV
ncbi:MAG: hypothetical protein K2N12_06985 [Helicobacter sp.]|nr:hypothetical protein [Helicobacter sp.]